MSEPSAENLALAASWRDRAWATWTELQGIVAGEYWYAAANRMYYACFYMVLAILVKDGFSSKTHAGAMSLWGLHYVKTGNVPKEFGSLYGQLMELRERGDYCEWREIAKEDITPLMPLVKNFLETLSAMVG